ncbi:MAG: hypothetical protein LBN25_05280 [Christensenellaceae bacterium]|jgi:vacuolar-type H+-ATPase subunit E/Vma4|nr:hypothetical protein [Christensenellaceae bacterium]
MSGQNALLEAIKQETAASVAEITAAANAKSCVIIEEAETKAAEIVNTANAKAERTSSEAITRANAAAASEIIKAERKAVGDGISKAFELTLSAIKALPTEKYLNYILELLKNAENGETVLIADNDKDIITKDFIAAAAKKYGIDIKLGGFADIKGGIILVGVKTDKNLSLESEIKLFRGDNESRVAEIIK